MIEITRDECWEDKFEDKPQEKKRMSFENKMVAIGLSVFGICTIINIILIYTFFNILKKF